MHIAVVGCLGIGKSRLTHSLAQQLGYRAFFEPVKENPYLDDFYGDSKRHAAIMQFFMLTARFRQHLEIQKLCDQNVGVVQDQAIFGDVLYGQLTHEFGYMDDRDYETYRQHFLALEPLLRLPDVVVLLEADVDSIQTRIKERGRISEQRIEPAYLSRLSELFREWVERVEHRTKVVRLDWNGFRNTDAVIGELEEQLDFQLRLPVGT